MRYTVLCLYYEKRSHTDLIHTHTDRTYRAHNQPPLSGWWLIRNVSLKVQLLSDGKLQLTRYVAWEASHISRRAYTAHILGPVTLLLSSPSVTFLFLYSLSHLCLKMATKFIWEVWGVLQAFSVGSGTKSRPQKHFWYILKLGNVPDNNRCNSFPMNQKCPSEISEPKGASLQTGLCNGTYW